MKIRTLRWTPGSRRGAVERFLARPAFDPGAEDVARTVLAEIAEQGVAAIVRYVARYDGVDLAPNALRVTASDIKAAARKVPAAHRKAVKEAHRRVAAFSRAGLRADWRVKTAHGGSLGEQFTPFDRVGVYIPGGKAPLASSAVMTATLAQVAGVPEIVACTPCGPDGTVNPVLLYALHLSGATEVYRVGGIQAIGLMACGAAGIAKVQKIVGPGGTYVTAAKRQVYGHVALDLVAGPSEIAVLADEAADPGCVAADLLSQAEHGTGWEKALLVTPSARLAESVAMELVQQTATLSRREAITKVLRKGTLLVVVDDLAAGVELCNRFAPEHLELMVRRPRQWLRSIRCAGAVFIGPWTPESAGDFAAGPSHVLPTGGAAAMFSGLTVDDFRRRSSVVEYRKADLEDALPVIEAFGEIEGLDAHARSARMRCRRS